MADMLPKDYINSILIDEIGDIVKHHPYLAFMLICSGIEFLGKCLDADSGSWDTTRPNGVQFKNAIYTLFPTEYHVIADDLYSELRCGMVHAQRPGIFKLEELKNNKDGSWSYDNHLALNSNIIILDYLYFDFVEAGRNVIAMEFDQADKMNQRLLTI